MPDSTGTGADSHVNADAESDRTAPRSATRRRLLTASGGVAATLLAGCSGLVPEQVKSLGGSEFGDGSSGGSGGSGGSEGGTGEEATPSGTATRTPTPETDVVGLSLDETGGGYELSVTLSPPADAGGADWWQLETLDGERIVRESFDEPRTTDRFMTARTVDPDSSKVVVRGHDTEFGYGGQVILADLEDGNLTTEDQGEEPTQFENYEF